MNGLGVTCGALTVIVAGVSCGAMLTGAMVLVPSWRAMPPAEFLAWFAANAGRMQLFFGPLQAATIVLAIASAILFRIGGRPGAISFAIAAMLATAVLATFPLYFRSANASFVSASISLGDVPAELARWSAWQLARTALGLAAFAAGLSGIQK